MSRDAFSEVEEAVQRLHKQVYEMKTPTTTPRDIDRLQAEIVELKARIERGKDQFVHLVAISCIADSAEIADAAREGIRVLDP